MNKNRRAFFSSLFGLGAAGAVTVKPEPEPPVLVREFVVGEPANIVGRMNELVDGINRALKATSGHKL